MQIEVKEVSTKKEFRIFYTFQNRLYKNVPNYVPSLNIDQKVTLKSDPAIEYCERKLWLAWKDGKAVGRIQGIINPRYNEFYNLKRIRFGWFDFIEDFEVAKALLDTAMAWGRERGMTEIHGPLAYNTLGRQGMLVEGYENLPPTNCLYNFPYYVDYMNKLGFEKEADWVQYKLNAMQGVPNKLRRMSDILMQRYNLRLLDIKHLTKEQRKDLTAKFFRIYNECFKSVHNFIPLTDKEIEHTGDLYFKLLKPELTCMVMAPDNDIAAFGFCLPSLSPAFQNAKGKLFPFGWYHILRGYQKYDTIDLMMVGSNPAWASKGLSAIFHTHLADNFQKYKIKYGITNPQLDTNHAAIKVWESYDYTPFMRRRCWIKNLKAE